MSSFYRNKLNGLFGQPNTSSELQPRGSRSKSAKDTREKLNCLVSGQLSQAGSRGRHRCFFAESSPHPYSRRSWLPNL